MSTLHASRAGALGVLALVALAGCSGSSGGGQSGALTPRLPGPAAPAPSPTPPVSASHSIARATFVVHVPRSQTESLRLSATSRGRSQWVSPSSGLLVLDVASINGAASPSLQGWTQSQPLNSSTCVSDTSSPSNGVDCTITFTSVPAGTDVLRLTATDPAKAGQHPSTEPVAADGKTPLGPALSQNFFTATIAAGGTPNCDSANGPIVNCVSGALDAVVAAAYTPFGAYPAITAPMPGQPTSAYGPTGVDIAVGFLDYDGNPVVGGGAGNLALGDTAVYTTVAQALANLTSKKGAETLDTLFVSSSASDQPLVLTSGASLPPSGVVASGATVSTTAINGYIWIASTGPSTTTLCEWDTAGVIGNAPAGSCPAAQSTTYTPPSGTVGGVVY